MDSPTYDRRRLCLHADRRGWPMAGLADGSRDSSNDPGMRHCAATGLPRQLPCSPATGTSPTTSRCTLQRAGRRAGELREPGLRARRCGSYFPLFSGSDNSATVAGYQLRPAYTTGGTSCSRFRAARRRLPGCHGLRTPNMSFAENLGSGTAGGRVHRTRRTGMARLLVLRAGGHDGGRTDARAAALLLARVGLTSLLLVPRRRTPGADFSPYGGDQRGVAHGIHEETTGKRDALAGRCGDDCVGLRRWWLSACRRPVAQVHGRPDTRRRQSRPRACVFTENVPAFVSRRASSR